MFWLIAVLILIAALRAGQKCIIKKLHNFDQAHLQTYEGNLLMISYYDDKAEPQIVFDTSQLEEKGLMAIIYVNPVEEVETIYAENILVGVDDKGICGIVSL